jgi:restriction endonuclease S subunit
MSEKMQKTKPSGIEWIGDIPVEWDIFRFRYAVNIRSEKAKYIPDKDIYIGLENVESSTGKFIKSENEYEEGFYDVFRKSDILFGLLRPYLEKVFFSEHDGFCTGEFLVIENFIGEKRYLFYFLLSHGFLEIVNASTYGAKMPRASWEYIKNLSIPVLSLTEQQAIASFLDTQCKKIDGIIADTEQQIEVLKQYKTSLITETVTKGLDKSVPMKDSGIEWIGKIPAGWEVIRFRYAINIRAKKAKYTPDKDIYIGLENVEGSTGKFVKSETEYEEGFYDVFRKNDILFGLLRPYLKKVFFAECDGFCTGEFLVIKNFVGEKRYLFYLLLSNDFLEIVNASTYGAKMPRASWEYIKNLSIPILPLTEQQAIASFLDDKCEKIDGLISDKQESIETMKSYKRSLIYEYVTGKKRVKI